jgi:ABC-type proline/glycine betaine transport system permease subunit
MGRPGLQAKVNAARVRIAAEAALVVNGAGVRLEALDLDGALVITACAGAPGSGCWYMKGCACKYHHLLVLGVAGVAGSVTGAQKKLQGIG